MSPADVGELTVEELTDMAAVWVRTGRMVPAHEWVEWIENPKSKPPAFI